jgi:glyceraldehyde-3-phosphate dehydrogenase/erythrose-4-phosphate dehydrogenase
VKIPAHNSHKQIGTNSCGRIGRDTFRTLPRAPLLAELEVVAIKDLTDIKTINMGVNEDEYN